MEQAASGALSSLLAQLGIFGIGLALLIAVIIWWFRATKDLRDEKEGVIGRLQKETDSLKVDRDKYREAYLALKYPGSGADPFDQPQGGDDA